MCDYVQGYPRDDSDMEWDEHIVQSYGQAPIATSTAAPSTPPDDEFDFTDSVTAILNTYDELCGEIF